MFCFDLFNCECQIEIQIYHIHILVVSCFALGSWVSGEEVQGDGFDVGVTLYTEAHYVVVAVQVRVLPEAHGGLEVFDIGKSGSKLMFLEAYGTSQANA